MDHSAFSALLAQLKKAPLAADKFYLLQKATRSLFFSPAQCLDIVRCFTHSEDKAAITDLIEKRLCTKVDPKCAGLLVKSAAFSKDRLKILKALLKHLQELTENEAKSLVASCFDSERDRLSAWAILGERFEFLPTPDRVGADDLIDFCKNDTAPCLIFQYIENLAKSNAQPMSAFDLPLLDELSLLRKTILERRQAIADEVEKRHRDGHHFVVPSRISSITRNLKPGRISAIAIDGSCAKETNAVHWTAEPHTEIPETPEIPSTKIDSSVSASKIWNIVNPAYTSPLAAYYVGLAR